MGNKPNAVDQLDESKTTHFPEVIFPAGNSDFRAVRNRCARACREFNNTPDDADPEERTRKWLDIVRPDRNRAEDGAAVTHDQTFSNPSLKAKTPFVKPPLYVDYGIRLHVGGSTFINRGCTIMDTPVADVVIGEGCNIGPNCTIIGVTHPVRLEERLMKSSIGQPVTIGDNVWIGANVTIMGGVTIGDGAVIGACSLIKRDIPPMTIAFGSPARVVGSLNDVRPIPADAVKANTLAEATALRNRRPMRRYTGQDSSNNDAAVADDADDRHHNLGRQSRLHSDLSPRRALFGGSSMCGNGGERSTSHEASGLYANNNEFGSSNGHLAGRTPFGATGGPSATAGNGFGATCVSPASVADGRDLSMLLQLQQQLRKEEQRLKMVEIKAFAAAAVLFALLVAFFFAGVYVGANRFAM